MTFPATANSLATEVLSAASDAWLTAANDNRFSIVSSGAGDLLTLADSFAGSSNNVTYTDTYTNAHQLASEAISNTNYSWQPTAATTTYATANTLNQYPSVNGVSQTYDTRGNLTSDGTWTYAYDAENHLMTASKSGVSAAYAYDPLGRRVEKSGSGVTTTYFLNDGTDEIAEYSAPTTLLRRFVPGPAINEPVAMVTASGTKTFFAVNRQGSVVAMSDTSGNLAEGQYTYDSYGNGGSLSGVPFKYVGMYLDAETGLYYDRARYYCSNCGRFLQTDSIGYKDNLVLYAYTYDDPLNFADPSGRGAGDDAPCAFFCYALGGPVPINDEFGNQIGTYNHQAFSGSMQLTATAASIMEMAAVPGGEAVGGVRTLGVAGFEAFVAKAGFSRAFEDAALGGRNAGFITNNLERNVSQLERGIQSLDSNIAEHEAKIADPAQYVKNTTGRDWSSMDSREQQGLVSHWRTEISNFKEQKSILQDLSKLKQTKVCTGSRIPGNCY
jgi:RHS repeat-associated protein